jgi:UrcA family protein
MPRNVISSRLLLSAAGALALALSVGSARAQDYRPSDNAPSYDRDGPETVEVYAYRYPNHTARGGEIIHASLSGGVSAYDLDLTTSWGAHVFRARILEKARELCEQLDIRYPVNADGENHCYRRAASHGMEDADAAIDHARRLAGRDRD